MRKLLVIVSAVVGVFVVAGCGSSEATATKQEEDSFRNPPKQMPKEAQDAMANMGKQGGPPAGATSSGGK